MLLLPSGSWIACVYRWQKHPGQRTRKSSWRHWTQLYKRGLNLIDISTFPITLAPTTPSLATNTTMKKNKESKPILHPLGRNIFATVKTWRRAVKIYAHHYKRPTNTKGGRAVPTQKGVSLKLREFEKRVKLKNKLVANFNQQASALPVVGSDTTTPSSSAAAAAAAVAVGCSDNLTGVTTPPCTPPRPSTLRDSWWVQTA